MTRKEFLNKIKELEKRDQELKERLDYLEKLMDIICGLEKTAEDILKN